MKHISSVGLCKRGSVRAIMPHVHCRERRTTQSRDNYDECDSDCRYGLELLFQEPQRQVFGVQRASSRACRQERYQRLLQERPRLCYPGIQAVVLFCFSEFLLNGFSLVFLWEGLTALAFDGQVDPSGASLLEFRYKGQNGGLETAVPHRAPWADPQCHQGSGATPQQNTKMLVHSFVLYARKTCFGVYLRALNMHQTYR